MLQFDIVVLITENIGDLFQVSGTLILELEVLDKSVAGILVALYEQRTVDGKGYIPADITYLRDTLMSLFAHLKSLFDAVDVYIRKALACHGMCIINVAVIIYYVAVDPAVLTDAEVQIVGTADDLCVILIDTQCVSYHMRLAVLIQSDDSERVYDIRIDLIKVLMLDDGVFDKELILGYELLIQSVDVLDIGDLQFADAVTALAVGLLYKNGGFIL